jgi:hypothetical protein
VKQRWIATSPLAEITTVGQRNQGKKQLRIDEARKLVDLCITHAHHTDGATARRARTRRVVGTVAPKAPLRTVEGAVTPGAEAAARTQPKPIRRAPRETADPALQAAGSTAASAAAAPAEPTGSPPMLGNG